MEVIKVKSGDSFAIINKSDYREGEHELYEGESFEGRSAAQDRADELETERQLQANRGVVSSYSAPTDKNTSGTFSEPTPSDIRFPDKTATEHENNLQSYVGLSAPQAREQAGLPDAPGGIKPQEAAEKLFIAPTATNVVSDTPHQPDLQAAGEAAKDADVAIPDDWSSLSWQRQVALGKQITGKDDLTAAEAREAIQKETERRASAE